MLQQHCPPLLDTAKSSEFLLEHSGYPRVGRGSIDESDELFRSVTSVHVEGEKTAILAADSIGKTLQLYGVVIQDGAIALKEKIYGRKNRWQCVRVEIVG
jgi:hypothetical protein